MSRNWSWHNSVSSLHHGIWSNKKILLIDSTSREIQSAFDWRLIEVLSQRGNTHADHVVEHQSDFLGLLQRWTSHILLSSQVAKIWSCLLLWQEFLTAKDSACHSGFTILLSTESSQIRMPNKPPPKPSSMYTSALDVVQSIVVVWYPFWFISSKKRLEFPLIVHYFLNDHELICQE